MKTLIVCDLQPDVVQKLRPPESRRVVDLCHLAVEACRRRSTSRSRSGGGGGGGDGVRILFLLLHFDEPGYTQIEPSHPKLGILRRLSAAASASSMMMKKPNWFTSKALSIPRVMQVNNNNNDDYNKDNNGNKNNKSAKTTEEEVLTRTTFLPNATDTKLLETLLLQQSSGGGGEFTVIGYGPTVQSICNLLGDVLAIPKVQIVQECVFDDVHERCQGFLQYGRLFGEEVVSLVDFLESMDLLNERIDIKTTTTTTTTTTNTNTNRGEGGGGLVSHNYPYQAPPPVKYVSDCGRGGHLTLFLPYLLRDHGYCLWPTQRWYQSSLSSLLGGNNNNNNNNKEYQCPLGRQMVDLCDEPQFSRGTKFFLAGRQHLDEKDLLNQLVPEIMPPTFDSIEAAIGYQQQQTKEINHPIWFLKKVNQNGGRAVIVTNELPRSLEEDDQLQIHVPRPLLWQEKYKFHIKTYQYIACTTTTANENADGDNNNNPSTTTTKIHSKTISWQMYMHDLFYMATASRPWSSTDLSDEAQITTMRTHRLYPDNPWRVQWKLTDLCRANMLLVLERAVEQGKLRSEHVTVTNNNSNVKKPATDSQNENEKQEEEEETLNSKKAAAEAAAPLQFEVNSADWMLDEDGRIYLIECNGIPVLYDGGMEQDLVTKGLQLYDKLYKKNPETAVVNDHDLLKEAIALAITGKLPRTSLWKHVATIPGKE